LLPTHAARMEVAWLVGGACLVVLACLLVVLLVDLRRLVNAPTLQAWHERTTAVLVTAHPDDECMFFTPTILNLRERGVAVHVVCLSTGNFRGRGSLRRVELEKACATLDIRAACVHVIDDAALQVSIVAGASLCVPSL